VNQPLQIDPQRAVRPDENFSTHADVSGNIPTRIGDGVVAPVVANIVSGSLNRRSGEILDEPSRLEPYRQRPTTLFDLLAGAMILTADIVDPLDVEWEVTR